MAFDRIIDFANAQAVTGATWTNFIHKTSLPVFSSAGMWADASMGAGTPKYNAYVGTQGESTPMYGAGNFGIYTGGDVSENKHLAEIMLQSTLATLAPADFLLCDYLLNYPLIDMDSTDKQDLDNIAPLPRYANGEGVRIMAVCTTPQSAVAQVNIVYTNQAGVAGRMASFFTNIANTGLINNSAVSTGAASGANPFLPLQGGDTGVRSIQSITCLDSAGGFCAFVLVKPLANIALREKTTPVEVNYIKDFSTMPRIYNGACLNFIYSSAQAAQSGILRGSLTFNWG